MGASDALEAEAEEAAAARDGGAAGEALVYTIGRAGDASDANNGAGAANAARVALVRQRSGSVGVSDDGLQMNEFGAAAAPALAACSSGGPLGELLTRGVSRGLRFLSRWASERAAGPCADSVEVSEACG